MNRISTFLHHTCKAAPGGYVLQRRKALRREVDTQLRKEMVSTSSHFRITESIESHAIHPPKKRRVDARNTVVETSNLLVGNGSHFVPQTQRTIQSRSGGSSEWTESHTEQPECTVPSSIIDEIPAHIMERPFEAWLGPSDQDPGSSSLNLLRGARESGVSQLSPDHNPPPFVAPNFFDKNQHHGAMIPGSKAPVMYMDTMLGSRAPIICPPVQMNEAGLGYTMHTSQLGGNSHTAGDSFDRVENLGFGSASTHGGYL